MSKRKSFSKATLERFQQYTHADQATTKAAIGAAVAASDDEGFAAAMAKHQDLADQAEAIAHNLDVEAAGPAKRGPRATRPAGDKPRAPRKKKEQPAAPAPHEARPSAVTP